MNSQLIGNIIYIVINSVFFCIIGYITYRFIVDVKNSEQDVSPLLFYNGIFFNFITFAASFGLFIFAIFHVEAILNNTEIETNKAYMIYHSFGHVLWKTSFVNNNPILSVVALSSYQKSFH